MRNSQLSIRLVFAASPGFALGSCDSSSSSSNPDRSSSSGNGLMCPAGSSGSCTQAELDTYDNCVFTQCASAVATCYGPGYKSGSFSGPCASYGTCISKCSCTDSACRTACGQPSSDCSTCQSNIGVCAFSSTCTIPPCLLGGGAGGTSGGAGGHVGGAGGFTGSLGGSTGATGGCVDLLACCNAANAAVKPTCMTGYTMAVSMGDSACGQFLAAIKSSVCP